MSRAYFMSPTLPTEPVWRGELREDDDTIPCAVVIIDDAHKPLFFAYDRWREPGYEFGYRIMAAWATRPTAESVVVMSCGANVDRNYGGDVVNLVCQLPRGHEGDHNTGADGGGDVFPNLYGAP